MLKLAGCLLLCGVLIGCSTPSSHVITGEVRPATSPAEVVVYEQQPEQFTEIAIVSATKTRTVKAAAKADPDDIIDALKSEAAALGANGIILTSVSEEAFTDRVTSYDGVQSGARDVAKVQKTAQGLAIFTE
ncbi:hypothetical protein [Arsukibacterium sp.]|uniref:hypothetical protein n=1 Tax=Arsukibacterium sp. TaxID=1977258 RepID=UPI001BD6761A|nr:hypothetical protein [Arsukibacterium sp.]